MTMITLAVFCKCTGRKGAMLYVPVAFLLCCTFTSLVQSIMGCVTALSAGTAASVFNSVLQLVFAILPGPRFTAAVNRLRAVHQGVRLPARRGARVVRARPQELRRRGP